MSSIIGNSLRTTKDIDASLKGKPLSLDNVRNIFSEILSIDIEDNVSFKIDNIEEIRLNDKYGGYRINVFGKFYKIRANFFIEITTGDVITPKEINFKYQSIFEEKTINIMTYTIETVLAEKFETIISKNITSSRAKDFYDIYIFVSQKKELINYEVLVEAIKNTFNKRNTSLDDIEESFELIKDSQILKNSFNNYKNKMPYVKDIEYEHTIQTIKQIVELFVK